MLEMHRTIPVWVEQLRAKIVKGLADGHGVVTIWARQVDKSRRFRERVGAFGRNEIAYLDLWEMLALFSVIYDRDMPRIQRVKSKHAGNGRKTADFPKPKTIVDHPALKG